MHSILQQAARIDDRRVALGLDSKQLLGTNAAQRADAGQHLRPGDVIGAGQGYFKLAQGREGDVVSADGVKGMSRICLWSQVLSATRISGGLSCSWNVAASKACNVQCLPIFFIDCRIHLLSRH